MTQSNITPIPELYVNADSAQKLKVAAGSPTLTVFDLGATIPKRDLEEMEHEHDHGHAHAGSEIGATAGGISVRNVAQPVLGQAYKVYCVEPTRTFANVSALGGLAG